jgi:hypothetical protein
MVAPDYEVDPEALRQKFLRMKKSGGRHHGNQLFSVEQEETFVGVLQAFSMKNRGLTKAMFLREVTKLRDGSEKWNGDKWFHGFLRRHKQRLSSGVVKGLKQDRTGDVTLDDVEAWVEWFPAWFKQKGLSSLALLNVDETRITIQGDLNSAPVIESMTKRKGSRLEPTRGKGASLLPFINAAGIRVMTVYVLPLNEIGVADFPLYVVGRRNRKVFTTYYMFTETGYVNEEAWIAIMEQLKKDMANLYPGLTPIVICDNLKAHRTDAAVSWFVKNGMHMVLFPPNVTHFLQPCDDKVFAVFKRKMHMLIQERTAILTPTNKDLGSILIGIAQEVDPSIGPDIIKASFRDTGVWPFDGRKIVDNAKKNLGVAISKEKKAFDTEVVARRMSMDVISEQLGKKKHKKARLKPEKKKLYSSGELHAQTERFKQEEKEVAAAKRKARETKEQAKEAAKKARRDQRKQLTCRGRQHDGDIAPVWYSSNKWLWCEGCLTYGHCPKCDKKDAEWMREHEQACKGKK